MNQSIKVSILMPVYKVEQYLEKALNSIFTQTYQNIDFVFVNDCSPDNSLQVLKDTITKHGIEEGRYTIINHEQNEGIAVSRADCIANAKGEYVLFVDSDDWIEPDMVEAMVVATGGGQIDIVGSDIVGDYPDGRMKYHHENYAGTCRENLLRCLNYEINTVLWKLLIRRKLFFSFEILPHLNIGEDYIISVKLYYYAKTFKSLQRAYYHYVQYNQSRLSFQRLRSLNDHVRAVKEVERFCREKGIYDINVEHKLNLRKFNIKSNFLTKQLRDYEAYRTVFPEANRVWRKIPYSKTEKIKFWLAEKGLYILLKNL
jgi:glycosyltransferase involved in cell wall biosynthesis